MLSNDLVLIKPLHPGSGRSVPYRAIERSLAVRWKSLRVVRAASEWELFRMLSPEGNAGLTFVFTPDPYLDSWNRTGFLPQILERWGYPHLGPPAAAAHAAGDPARLRRILGSRGIPTRGPHPEGRPPVHRAVFGPKRARRFFVGIVGSHGRLRFPVEARPPRSAWAERFFRLPRLSALEDAKTRSAVQELADEAFDAVDARDFGTVEILRDHDGFAVLDVDLMPDLGRRSVLSTAAERAAGMDYEELIRMVAASSMARQGIAF